MVHQRKKTTVKTGKGIHKYDIRKEIEKTRTAYADTWMGGEEGYKKRNLQWKGTAYLTPKDWFECAKFVGEYNAFDPKKVHLILGNFPDARIKLARQGSVAIFIKPKGHNPKHIMRDLRVLGDADELGLVKGVTSKFTEEKGGKIIRVWWD